ncbi:MAG: hypothetical protein EXX96DRAFT_518850 [Benjaminiella poitrasii]|nr:MAG: hypothetical protein EXX96DRAFT_518850 [Benjaminiella poitrasii]
MENKQDTTTNEQLTEAVAVLQIHNDNEDENTLSSYKTTSSSHRSSIDNHYDPREPHESNLVINELQSSVTEEQQNVSKISETIDNNQHVTKKETLVTSNLATTKNENDVFNENQKQGHNVSQDDTRACSANNITLGPIDSKLIEPNLLNPREQERADVPILRAIHHVFNNRFMQAKELFEQQSKSDPLHALGLGSMAFLKSLMSTDQQTTTDAIKVLLSTYDLACAQIDNATKRNVSDTIYQHFKTYYASIKYTRGTGIPMNVKPVKPKALETHRVDVIPNGVLRAHIVKAEASLQMAILYLLQQTIPGYIKCGLNLRRAYTSYSIVWQEYRRTGQLHNDYIDKNTIAGIQLGIGAVHLVLSSLPKKILRIISAFGWKADKHLGFALLKLCLEDRSVRSPMASLMLLAYYTSLTNLCPHLLAEEYIQPAIETLLDAQRNYPNSSIFLYFAGRTSRIARNLDLSTQSFEYAIETSKNEWAEVDMLHLCSYELGFNHMMKGNWEEAAKIFNTLCEEGYWSPVVMKYLTGACLDMMGQTTDAILAFAEIPILYNKKINKNKTHASDLEHYITRKVEFFQTSGYQDMDMTMCALEYLYLFNAYEFMNSVQLEQNLGLVDYVLSKILETEKLEYSIRARELMPETPPPEYHEQRGVLLLIKSAILNAMGRFQESVVHLNWIIDHKEKISEDKWIIPYTFWEVGMTSWNLNQKARGRLFWETALGYTSYDFEYRLAMRVSLAVTRAEELGIHVLKKNKKPEFNNSSLRQQEDSINYMQQELELSDEESDTSSSSTETTAHSDLSVKKDVYLPENVEIVLSDRLTY